MRSYTGATSEVVNSVGLGSVWYKGSVVCETNLTLLCHSFYTHLSIILCDLIMI